MNTDSRGSTALLYSRPYVHVPTNQLERESTKDKKLEYFLLVRDPAAGKTIDGRYLIDAHPSEQQAKLAVGFTFNTSGGILFHQVTSDNQPGKGAGGIHRQLAIILDGMIESAPGLNSPISTSGVITGDFTKKQVDHTSASSRPVPCRPR